MDTIAELRKDNASENAHLKSMVENLSEDDLRLPMEAGWTVSAVLAHMAFWDQRAIILIDLWKKDGIGPSPIDTDVVNEATRRLCLAIPPRQAVELAISLADEVDALIASLTPEMLEEILTKGTAVNLRRANHRRSHLGDIKKTLQGGK